MALRAFSIVGRMMFCLVAINVIDSLRTNQTSGFALGPARQIHALGKGGGEWNDALDSQRSFELPIQSSIIEGKGRDGSTDPCTLRAYPMDVDREGEGTIRRTG